MSDTKLCRKCLEVLPMTFFNIKKGSSDGYQWHCKECSKELTRVFKRKKLYGVTPDYYELMLLNQNGRCAICKTDNWGTTPHVDHCHTTGKVRGLLCHKCNTGIGLLNDNVDIMNQAIQYLTEHSP